MPTAASAFCGGLCQKRAARIPTGHEFGGFPHRGVPRSARWRSVGRCPTLVPIRSFARCLGPKKARNGFDEPRARLFFRRENATDETVAVF